MACVARRSRWQALFSWHAPAILLLYSVLAAPVGAADDPQPAEQPPADAAAAPPPDESSAAPATSEAAAAPPAAEASQHAFHGSVQLDNEYSIDTQPLRATFALSYGGLFSKTDEISAAYQLAPQDVKQVSVFVANYTARALPEGFTPSFYFIDSSTNVPAAETSGVIGKGEIVGTRISHALSSAAAGNQLLSLAVEYKHFRNTAPFDDALVGNAEISYLDLALAYSGYWSAGRREASLNVSANFGPHGGANAADAYAQDDFHARADYFYLRADGAIIAPLPKGVRLYLRVAGEYTRQSLNLNEEYAVAGYDGVRGYLEAEVLGDRAVKATVQLQSPAWEHGSRAIADAFLFFDGATAEMLQTLPGETATLHPRSWGFGIDLVPWKSLTGTLILARPLVSAYDTQAGDTRLLFLVRASF